MRGANAQNVTKGKHLISDLLGNYFTYRFTIPQKVRVIRQEFKHVLMKSSQMLPASVKHRHKPYSRNDYLKPRKL